MISIRVLKLCGSSIFKPHRRLFKSCVKKGGSIFEGKKASVITKKVRKKTLKNYQSIFNNLLSSTQSGFKQGNSGHGVRGVFLNISKTFDEIKQKGLLFKLKQKGISGNILSIVTDFSNNRKQRVALIGQNSAWTILKT